jgi:hypothetical protein
MSRTTACYLKSEGRGALVVDVSCFKCFKRARFWACSVHAAYVALVGRVDRRHVSKDMPRHFLFSSFITPAVYS